ncbi:hypothetical protein Tsubulata_012234 [Turnera subulata]|uniref:HTH myb-type domain-containing protein n=1 Tax=Turnera subulata TaxID=218843 RepID=A0A9Q0FIW9_9ROSI|nr:hypothetical protein Tsubulata_012234 [Turnera subulata]
MLCIWKGRLEKNWRVVMRCKARARWDGWSMSKIWCSFAGWLRYHIKNKMYKERKLSASGIVCYHSPISNPLSSHSKAFQLSRFVFLEGVYVLLVTPELSLLTLFLLGLDKYGKGDWRSISRNFVVTRTPTQVASHAQKYFIRLNSMNKDRRRSSIHDITSVGNGDIAVSQGPITGQTNGSSTGTSGKAVKQPPQHPAGPPGVAMYGPPTIGQPIGGPLVSAVGTPVNLPAPAHMAYGVRAPMPGALPGTVPGTVVPGAPMNMGPMTYPMPPTTTHR